MAKLLKTKQPKAKKGEATKPKLFVFEEQVMTTKEIEVTETVIDDRVSSLTKQVARAESHVESLKQQLDEAKLMQSQIKQDVS